MKESKILLSFLLSNLLIVFFYFTKNAWGWIMIIAIMPTLYQMFFYDRSDRFETFFLLHNINTLQRHYSKVILIGLFSSLALVNMFFYTSVIHEDVTELLIKNICVYALYAFCFFIKSDYVQILVIAVILLATHFIAVSPHGRSIYLSIIGVSLAVHTIIINYDGSGKV